MGPIRDPQDVPERELSAKSTLKGWCIIKVIKKSRKSVLLLVYDKIFKIIWAWCWEKGRKEKGTKEKRDKRRN
ncbi:hypothetical protein C2G38_2202632 [Gigaspora rosea]|uniref:Uncharacterized protein n=1 Tax=Gigaspora rosea TaxID=44941 RepID=A0A397UWY5_9GLOM|nr:hypothetical protein C2G38_2202632 [Gigaspora rosea]